PSRRRPFWGMRKMREPRAARPLRMTRRETGWGRDERRSSAALGHPMEGPMTQPLLLWQHLGAVLQRCVTHAWCAVLLDYDGTLAPLVADPARACLSPAMRQVLTLLVQHPHVQVAIMSGRTLADLQRHVDGQVPYLAGNHGLEMAGPQAIYCHPDARRLRPELAALAQSLHHHLCAHAGVWVEDKGLTLTVHVRGVPPACRRAVPEQIVHLLRPALETRQFALRTGTAVLEVRPRV